MTEAPATVRDDEEEVFDLGFIVEEREDRRDGLLADWQRLDDLDTDEALETGLVGPLPEPARALEEHGVPPAVRPTKVPHGSVAAEVDEAEFAEENLLLSDPYLPPPYDLLELEPDAAYAEEALDGEEGPEAPGVRGRAAGVAQGFRVMEEPSVPGNLHQPEIGEVEEGGVRRPEVEGPPPTDRPRPEREPPGPPDRRR